MLLLPCQCVPAKFPLSSVSILYITSILFKKDSFPVEFVLYAEAPRYAVPFLTSMTVHYDSYYKRSIYPYLYSFDSYGTRLVEMWNTIKQDRQRHLQMLIIICQLQIDRLH
jgi:hypothetical protein